MVALLDYYISCNMRFVIGHVFLKKSSLLSSSFFNTWVNFNLHQFLCRPVMINITFFHANKALSFTQCCRLSYPRSNLWDNLACRMFITGHAFYQYLWKREDEIRIEKREKQSCDLAPTKACIDLPSSAGAGGACQSWPELGKGLSLFSPCWSSIDVTCAWKDFLPWEW